MSRFILEIELGNDAMKDAYDVGTVMINIACYLRESGEITKRKIHDLNGNTVGHYEVVEE
jgi:hypothetical protein